MEKIIFRSVFHQHKQEKKQKIGKSWADFLLFVSGFPWKGMVLDEGIQARKNNLQHYKQGKMPLK